MKKSTVGLFILLLMPALFFFLGLASCSDEIVLCKVIFDSQGGSAVATVEAATGITVGEPTAPTKNGYVFDGWYEDSECLYRWNFTKDVVVSDITLYAKWTAVSYTVTFDSQGGSVPDPLNQVVVYGQTYGQLPSASRAGYTFGGWWTDEAGAEVQILSTTAVSVAEDHTLYAKWTADTYTVTFDGQCGTVPDSTTMSVTYDQQYGQLPVPTRDHHSFLGWYTGVNGTGTHVLDSTTVSITINQTLYAAWELNPYVGPAGGCVFYDKGFELDGWRYLEAAPAGWCGTIEDSTYFFGYSRITWDSRNLLAGTETAVGSGKPNTDTLVAALGNAPYVQSEGNLTATNYAAKICSNYSIQVDEVVYDDWFLPSKDELDLMYRNLYLNDLGGLSLGPYWSSSEQDSENTWIQIFFNGSQSGNQRSSYLKIRPVRMF
ncbi:MAG: hypothetical protein GXY60_11075 [Spirochaetales bacterium]|nr:hypothetical protein [Spirochaetales bacterium]